jgi:hypothetical protein
VDDGERVSKGEADTGPLQGRHQDWRVYAQSVKQLGDRFGLPKAAAHGGTSPTKLLSLALKVLWGGKGSVVCVLTLPCPHSHFNDTRSKALT